MTPRNCFLWWLFVSITVILQELTVICRNPVLFFKSHKNWYHSCYLWMTESLWEAIWMKCFISLFINRKTGLESTHETCSINKWPKSKYCAVCLENAEIRLMLNLHLHCPIFCPVDCDFDLFKPIDFVRNILLHIISSCNNKGDPLYILSIINYYVVTFKINNLVQYTYCVDKRIYIKKHAYNCSCYWFQ